jgi:hypothetical protein
MTAGDRVELASVGCQGTVEYADPTYVRVRWDDGQIGLLYYDDRMIPKARHLLKLVPQEDA